MHREALTVLFGIGVLVLGADCVAKTERVAGDAGSARPEPDSRVSLEQKGRADITSVRLFSHTVNNNEVTITKYMGPDGAVSIPCTVSGLPVRAIGDSAFDKRAGLTGVTVPDSVSWIGMDAFSGCFGLTAITVGKGVTSIGERAFSRPQNLQRVCFRGNAPDLGFDVFKSSDKATVYYRPGTKGWGPTFGGLPTKEWKP